MANDRRSSAVLSLSRSRSQVSRGSSASCLEQSSEVPFVYSDRPKKSYSVTNSKRREIVLQEGLYHLTRRGWNRYRVVKRGRKDSGRVRKGDEGGEGDLRENTAREREKTSPSSGGDEHLTLGNGERRRKENQQNQTRDCPFRGWWSRRSGHRCRWSCGSSLREGGRERISDCQWTETTATKGRESSPLGQVILQVES